MFPRLNWLLAAEISPHTARAGKHTAPDPGDMGTAFGLDASMEACRAATHRALHSRRGPPPWSQRLVRRPQR